MSISGARSAITNQNTAVQQANSLAQVAPSYTNTAPVIPNPVDPAGLPRTDQSFQDVVNSYSSGGGSKPAGVPDGATQTSSGAWKMVNPDGTVTYWGSDGQPSTFNMNTGFAVGTGGGGGGSDYTFTGGGGMESEFSPTNFNFSTGYQTYSGGTPTVKSGNRGYGTVPVENNMTQLAQQLVAKLAAQAPTDTTGMKENQKETLLALKGQATDEMQQSAASRGVSGGWVGEQEAQIGDDFRGDLTNAYRDIDIAAQQQDFARLLQSASAATGLGGQLFNENLANQQLGLQSALGFGGLDMQKYGLDIQKALGFGNLNLNRDLGLGDLSLRRDLGFGGLDLQKYGIDTNAQLGLAGINQNSLTLALRAAGFPV
jgi:hypothetical protein